MKTVIGVLLIAVACTSVGCSSDLIVEENTTQRCGIARRADWHLYVLVLVPIRNMSHPFSKVKVELAVQRSIRNHILTWFQGTVSFTFIESDCESNDGALEAYFAANMQRMADVFIGPVCSILNEFAQFASMWNLPVLAPGGTLIDNPDEPEIQPHNRNIAYDTVTLLGNFHFEEVSRFMFSLFGEFGWHRFLFLEDATSFEWIEPHYCSSLFAAMKHFVMQRSNSSEHVDLLSQAFEINRNLYERLRNQYAIVVVCAEPHRVREFLMEAQEEKLMTGEYVFVVLDLHSSEQRIHRPWLVAHDTKNNERARSAYRYVMMISALQNATSTYHELMAATVEHVTSVTGIAPSTIDVDRMWQFVGSFYDAIALFATSFRSWYEEQPVEPTQRTMRSAPGRPDRGFNVGYGREVTRQLRDRVFDGISGPVRIDRYGHKVTEYRALSLASGTDEFRTVILYAADCANSSSQPALVPVSGRSFFWSPGPPPPDIPRCGRMRCADDEHVPEWLIAISVVLGSVTVIAAGSFYYINRKTAVRMSAISWRVAWSDLELVQPNRILGPLVSSSVLSVRGVWADPTGNEELTYRRTAGSAPPLPPSGASQSQPPSSTGLAPPPTTVPPSSLAPLPTANPVSVSESDARLKTAVPPNPTGGESSKRRANDSRKPKAPKGVQPPRMMHTALYKGTFVHLQPIPECDANLSLETVREIRALKETTHFEHLCQVIGVCTDAPHWCIVTDYCSRGSLSDILDNPTFVMDVSLKFSLIVDLARALEYLHARYGPHGRLTTNNCLIDARFALKVTDFGLVALRKGAGRPLGSRALSFVRHTSTANNANVKYDDFDYYSFNTNDVQLQRRAEYAVRRLLYRSPELLRASKDAQSRFNTTATDAYSFAVIAHEIAYRKGTYWNAHSPCTYKEAIQRVITRKTPPYRPTLDVASLDAVLHDSAVANELVRFIGACWQEDPHARPALTTVSVALRGLHRGASNLLDNLLSRMEQYTNNLESLVAVRTQDYLLEKQKVEHTLFTLLPRSIASQLVTGRQVTAEAFDCVSIYFSDIAGFTAMCSQSSAIQVVNFLNDLYVAFDTIIGNYDAYKVETIGDAYMVVSGLPERNGNLHAREIARVALSLLRGVGDFRIAHRPGESLRVRIGLHSGPVCAGVVGVKMPRYCLFGDTVTVAKLMEGSGEAMRVQASDAIKTILDTFGTFEFEYRGEVAGHNGPVTSWWLLGESEVAAQPLPTTTTIATCNSSADLGQQLTLSTSAVVTQADIENLGESVSGVHDE